MNVDTHDMRRRAERVLCSRHATSDEYDLARDVLELLGALDERRRQQRDLDEQIEAEKRLAVELGDYEGKWVAVRDHHVVFSAATLDALLKLVNEQPVEGVFQVPPSGAAFFTILPP